MTVVARRVRSIPERSALETWAKITDLLASYAGSDSRHELESIAGIASSIITRDAMKNSALVVSGAGPRVRVFCLHDEDAITGDGANEQTLAFDATSGDWKMSIPCPADDLDWVQLALKSKSTRITARDMTSDVSQDTNSGTERESASFTINKDAFFRS